MAIHRRVLDCFAALAMTVLILWGTPAAAQHFPQLTGRVVDQANLLSPAERLDISSKSEALQAQTGRQFVVATVNSLEGLPIEDYSYRLGRAWGIGQKGKDDGVILLVAPNERKVWIATGYGAGAFLTDAMSGIIVREKILPQFKKDPPDYGTGITAGVDAVIDQMRLPPDQAKANLDKAQREQTQRQSGGSVLPAFFWIMIVIFVLLSMFRRAGGRRYRSRQGGISPWVVLWGLDALDRSSRHGGWDSGSSWGGGGGWGGGDGGGFSGGGGSFGGGGAGGSW